MPVLSRQARNRVGQLLLAMAGLVVLPGSASCDDRDPQWFPLRNNNPILQVYGLPRFQGGTLVADGEFQYSVGLDIANHADSGTTDSESMVFDGESYFLSLSGRYGASRWLELGIDVPLVLHTDGIFDNAIESWHDLWGMSNSKRSGPANQLRFFYGAASTPAFELTKRSFGIGDIQLTAAIPVRRPDATSRTALSLRSGVKIPTGEASTLRGSGAVDFSLGLFASHSRSLSNRDLRLTGFAGVLLPGEGDLFPALQRSSVAFGGLGASWQLTEKFSIAAQTYAQGSYLKSDLDEIGGNSIQLAIGGNYRLRGKRIELAFSLVEDVLSDATADVALHFSVRGYSKSRGIEP